MKRALSALGAVAFALTLSACPAPPECEVNGDCEGTEVCSEDGTCEPDPRPIRCDNGLLTCATTEVCDEVDGACKTCTATAGCSAGAAICDTAANNGMGVCKTCLSDNTGCGDTAPICDTAAGGGLGACIVCNATLGCRASQGETCDTAANGGAGACVECTGDSQCTEAGAPFCSAGTCVACRDSDSTPLGLDEGCAVGTQICDTTAASPVCRQPTCAEDADYCVGCVTNADCAATEFCGPPTPASQCEVPATNATVGAQIQAFLDALAGPQVTALPISGVLVTYIKPDLGSGAEAAGYFVQATSAGPAFFVEEAPGALAVGDRISFNVTEKAITAGMDIATLITGLTVISSGHPVNSLTPAGLKVDVSTATDAADPVAYESELVTITGTIPTTATFAFAGVGYSRIQLETTGVQGSFNLTVRFPDAVISAAEIQAGCTLTLKQGTYWRFNATAQITSSYASDLEIASCPPPALVGAIATANTSVTATFSRNLDAATVAASDFTIAGLTITSATLSPTSARKVILTTSAAQTVGTRYVVDVVDGAVSDVGGTAGVAGTASFWAYAPAPTGLVINEVESDDTGTDDAEFVEIFNPGASEVHIGGLQIVGLNGANTDEATRVPYYVLTLSGAVDSAGNPTDTIPAGGYLVVGAQTTVLDTISNSNVLEAQGVVGLQNGPDGVALVHFASGTVIDSVFYGAITNGYRYNVETGTGSQLLNFEEGAPTPNDVSATSLQRKPNGTDTNVNLADFAAAAPTPGAPTAP